MSRSAPAKSSARICGGAVALALSMLSVLAMAQTSAPPDVAAVPPGNPSASPAAASQPVPASRWTPAQIREAFDSADANSDGQLTRAEAQRLAIAPRSFEDMDTNKDGVLTRDEYEAAFAP
jgi:hypothetical protein